MANDIFTSLSFITADTELDYLGKTKDSLASFFGSMTVKGAEALYMKMERRKEEFSALALTVLDMLKVEGHVKPSSDEIQTVDDAVTVKVFNLLWAIALIGKCNNAEAFANRVLGRSVTQVQAQRKIAAMQSFITANFRKNEFRDGILDSLSTLKNVSTLELPEKANIGWTADMRQSRKVLKTVLVKAPKKVEAPSPEQELEEIEKLKIINKSF